MGQRVATATVPMSALRARGAPPGVLGQYRVLAEHLNLPSEPTTPDNDLYGLISPGVQAQLDRAAYDVENRSPRSPAPSLYSPSCSIMTESTSEATVPLPRSPAPPLYSPTKTAADAAAAAADVDDVPVWRPHDH
jgi:hypothetical protein